MYRSPQSKKARIVIGQKEIAASLPWLRHRLVLKPEAQLDNVQIDGVIASILKQISVPIDNRLHHTFSLNSHKLPGFIEAIAPTKD